MKKIYLLLVLMALITSCQQEELQLEDTQKTLGSVLEEISFYSLPPNLHDFFESKENSKSQISRRKFGPFGSVKKNIPVRKSQNEEGIISYTFALSKVYRAGPQQNYFDNLVITELDDKEKVLILRYLPQSSITARNISDYSGKIDFYDIEGNKLGSISLLNGVQIHQKESHKMEVTTCEYQWYELCTGDACVYGVNEKCTTENVFDDGGDGGGGTSTDEPSGGGTTTSPIPDEEEQEEMETPCPGDPVKDPELAPQLGFSGLKGGLHGCTRYGTGCTGGEDGRNKPHDGIDIKNEYGDPIFAMYDGVVHSAYEHPVTGYVTRLKSVVNGETIINQYFHMQKERLTTKGTLVKAGDLIGRQGDSGNLRRAIEQGYAVSHVHIKISKYIGTGDSDNYNNYRSTNPQEFLGTSFDENGESITNNCN